jgi:hypothetical protein
MPFDAVVKIRLAIAAAVVAVVALAALLWQYQEAGRPALVEARVVTATASDPVFREGARHLEPGETFELAVAMRLEQRGREPYWISPAEQLSIDGELVEHDVTASWPEDDRAMRVLWHTIEGTFVGGELTEDNAAERLAYRTFFAPELGRNARVAGVLEAHNDDFLAEFTVVPEAPVGTLRFYARVEVVRSLTDVRTEHAVASLGTDALHDPRLPRVHQRLSAPHGIAPEVGELFLLPGFELGEGLTPATELPVSGTLLDAAERTARRLTVSSWTFAATAVTGDPAATPETTLTELGKLDVDSSGGTLSGVGGHALEWGDDVQTGDVLRSGDHWIVLVRDDGDRQLGLSDTVLHCWRRPPSQVTLLEALELGTASVLHLRPIR